MKINLLSIILFLILWPKQGHPQTSNSAILFANSDQIPKTCQDYQKHFKTQQLKIFNLPSELQKEGQSVSLLSLQREFDQLSAELSLYQGLNRLNKEMKNFLQGKEAYQKADQSTGASIQEINQLVQKAEKDFSIVENYMAMDSMLSVIGDNFTPQTKQGSPSAEEQVHQHLKSQCQQNQEMLFCQHVINQNENSASLATVNRFISAYTQAHSTFLGGWSTDGLNKEKLKKILNKGIDPRIKEHIGSAFFQGKAPEQTQQMEALSAEWEQHKRNCLGTAFISGQVPQKNQQECLAQFTQGPSFQNIEKLAQTTFEYEKLSLNPLESFQALHQRLVQHSENIDDFKSKLTEQDHQKFSSLREQTIHNILDKFEHFKNIETMAKNLDPSTDTLPGLDKNRAFTKVETFLLGAPSSNSSPWFDSDNKINLEKLNGFIQALQNQSGGAQKLQEKISQLTERLKQLHEAIEQVKNSEQYRETSSLKDYIVYKMRQFCLKDNKPLGTLGLSSCLQNNNPLGAKDFISFGDELVGLTSQPDNHQLLKDLSQSCEKQYNQLEKVEYMKNYSGLCSRVQADLNRTIQKSVDAKRKRSSNKNDLQSRTVIYRDGQGKITEKYVRAKSYTPWLLAGSEAAVRLGQWYAGSYKPNEYSIKLQQAYTDGDLRWIVPPNSNPWANHASQETWDAYVDYMNTRSEYFANPDFYRRVVLENAAPLNSTGNAGFNFGLQ